MGFGEGCGGVDRSGRIDRLLDVFSFATGVVIVFTPGACCVNWMIGRPLSLLVSTSTVSGTEVAGGRHFDLSEWYSLLEQVLNMIR